MNLDIPSSKDIRGFGFGEALEIAEFGFKG